MASQRSNTESGDTPRARDRARIVIVDRQPTEATGEIDEVVTSCRATTRRVSPGSNIEQNADDCRIALVAAYGQPTSRAPVLDDVRRLKALGFTVLCYAKGADVWPLGVRCRLLLTGATDVFDSAATDFARELRERLRILLDSVMEREHEAEHLRKQMLDLGVVGSGH